MPSVLTMYMPNALDQSPTRLVSNWLANKRTVSSYFQYGTEQVQRPCREQSAWYNSTKTNGSDNVNGILASRIERAPNYSSIPRKTCKPTADIPWSTFPYKLDYWTYTYMLWICLNRGVEPTESRANLMVKIGLILCLSASYIAHSLTNTSLITVPTINYIYCEHSNNGPNQLQGWESLTKI